MLWKLIMPLVLIASTIGGGPMSESSMPWEGDTGGAPPAAGDAGPYSANAWDDMYADGFGDGVAPGIGSELAVSGTSSPVTVGTGRAWVNGKYYKNTAALTIAVATPVAATRIDRIVLRADYTAQTVRAVRLAGVEGGAAPALTQSDGVTWEISLATVTITTAGAITVTSERTAADQGRLPTEIVIMVPNTITAAKNPTRSGLTFDRWFLCDGGTYNGRATPNMTDRLPIGVGTIVSSQGGTDGAATVDLAHTHGVGTLDNAAAVDHTHGVGTLDNAAAANHVHGVNIDSGDATGSVAGLFGAPTSGNTHRHNVAGNTAAGGSHDHALSGATAAGGAHDHAISGATASGGSATQDILNPVIGVRWFMYSP